MHGGQESVFTAAEKEECEEISLCENNKHLFVLYQL